MGLISWIKDLFSDDEKQIVEQPIQETSTGADDVTSPDFDLGLGTPPPQGNQELPGLDFGSQINTGIDLGGIESPTFASRFKLGTPETRQQQINRRFYSQLAERELEAKKIRDDLFAENKKYGKGISQIASLSKNFWSGIASIGESLVVSGEADIIEAQKAKEESLVSLDMVKDAEARLNRGEISKSEFKKIKKDFLKTTTKGLSEAGMFGTREFIGEKKIQIGEAISEDTKERARQVQEEFELPREVFGVPGKTVRTAAEGTGSMGVPIVANAISLAITKKPVLGTGAGSLAAFSQSKGASAEEFKQILASDKGISVDALSDDDILNVNSSSTIVGAIEGAIEMIPLERGLSGVTSPFKKKIQKEVAKGVTREVAEQKTKEEVSVVLAKAILQTPKEILYQGLAEGSEEGISAFAQNVVAKVNEIDPDIELDQGVVEQALAGFITGGATFGAASGVAQTVEQALPAIPAQSVNVSSDEGDVIASEDVGDNVLEIREVDPKQFEEEGKLKESFVDTKSTDVTMKLQEIVGVKDAKKYAVEIEDKEFKNYQEFVEYSTKEVSNIIADAKPALEAVSIDMASAIIGNPEKVNVTSVQPIPEYKTDVKIAESLTQSDKDDVKIIRDTRYTQETETRIANTIAITSNSDFSKPGKSEMPKQYDNKIQNVLTKRYQNIDKSVPIEKPKYLSEMAKKEDSEVFEQSSVTQALSKEAYDKLSIDTRLTGNAKIDKLAINKIQKDIASIAKNELSKREVALINADIKSLQSRIEVIQETANGILNQEALQMQAEQNIYNGKNLTEAPDWYAMFYRENKRNATEAEILEMADLELERKANDPEIEYDLASDYVSLKQSETILQGLIDSYETQLKKKSNRVDRYIVLSNSLKQIKSTESKIRKETYNRKEVNEINLQIEALERNQGEEINNAFKNITPEQKKLYKVSTESFINSFKDPYIVKKVKKQKVGEDKITYRFVDGNKVDTLRSSETIYGRLVDMSQKEGYDKMEDYFSDITNKDKRIKLLKQRKTNTVKRILANNPDFVRLMEQKQSVKNQLDSISNAYKDKNRLIQAVNLKQLKRMRSLINSRVRKDMRQFKKKLAAKEYQAKYNIRLYKAISKEYVRQYPALKSIIIQFTDKRLRQESGKTRISAMKLQDIESEFANKLDPYILQQEQVVELIDKINKSIKAKRLQNISDLREVMKMPFVPETDKINTRHLKNLNIDNLSRFYEVIQQFENDALILPKNILERTVGDWFTLPESRDKVDAKINNALDKDKTVKLFSRDEDGNFVFQQNITKENIQEIDSFDDPRIQIEGQTGRIKYPPVEGTFEAEDIKDMIATQDAMVDYFRDSDIKPRIERFENRIIKALDENKKIEVYTVDRNNKSSLHKAINKASDIPNFSKLIEPIKDEKGNIVSEKEPYILIDGKKFNFPKRQSRESMLNIFKSKGKKGVTYLERFFGAAQLAEVDSVNNVIATELIRLHSLINNAVDKFTREYNQKAKKAIQSRKTHDVLDNSISTGDLGFTYATAEDSQKTEIIAGATDIEKDFFSWVENDGVYGRGRDFINRTEGAEIRKDFGMPVLPARLSDLLGKKDEGVISAFKKWSAQEHQIQDANLIDDFKDDFQNENVSDKAYFNHARRRTGGIADPSTDYHYINLRYGKDLIRSEILAAELPHIKSLIDFASWKDKQIDKVDRYKRKTKGETKEQENYRKETLAKAESFKGFYKDHLDIIKGINPNLREKSLKTNFKKNALELKRFFVATALMWRLPKQVVNIVGQFAGQMRTSPLSVLQGLKNTSLIAANTVSMRFGVPIEQAENMVKIINDNPVLANGLGIVEEFTSLDKDIFDRAESTGWMGFAVSSKLDEIYHTISKLNYKERTTGQITDARIAQIRKEKGQTTEEFKSKMGMGVTSQVLFALTGWRNTEVLKTVNLIRNSGGKFLDTLRENKKFENVELNKLIDNWFGTAWAISSTFVRFEIFKALVLKNLMPEDEEDDNYIQKKVRRIFQESNSPVGAHISAYYQANDIMEEALDMAGLGREEEAFAHIKENESLFRSLIYTFGMRGYDKTDNNRVLLDQFFVTDRAIDLFLKNPSDIYTLLDEDSLTEEKNKSKERLLKGINKVTRVFGRDLVKQLKEEQQISRDLLGHPFGLEDDEREAYNLYNQTKDYSYQKKRALIGQLESDEDNKDNIDLAKNLKVMFANEEFTDDEKKFLSTLNDKVGGSYASANTQGTQIYLYIKRNNLNEEEESDFVKRYIKNYIGFGVTEKDSLQTLAFLDTNDVELSTKELKFYNVYYKKRGKEIANHVKSLQQGKNGLTDEEEISLINVYLQTGIMDKNIFKDYLVEMGIDLKTE